MGVDERAGQKIVREHTVEFPDFIELLQLGLGVVPEVADQLTHVGQFLCSTWAPSLLWPARDRVKVILFAVP